MCHFVEGFGKRLGYVVILSFGLLKSKGLMTRDDFPYNLFNPKGFGEYLL